MPGKTFAPLTQPMPLSSEDESHGLRRESHPARVAFLLSANSGSGVQAESQSLRTLIALCCGCGARGRAADLKILTSAHQPRKKKPPELSSQRLFDSVKPIRFRRYQERWTCTCFQMPSSFCQIRVSQQRAVTGSLFTSGGERFILLDSSFSYRLFHSWDK